MSQDRNFQIRGRFVGSFDECSDETKNFIREMLKIWAGKRGSNPAISAANLTTFVNDHVLDGWSSNLEPIRPVMPQSKITDQYVRIGCFNKDLPDPKQEKNFGNDTTPFARLAEMFEVIRAHKTPAVRKAGKTAYVRARLDKTERWVVYDYVDEKGRWAPVEYIDFTGHDVKDGKPSINGLARAHVNADKASAEHADDWNFRLAIYLSQVRIFNTCHYYTYQPRLEANEVALNINHFLSPARICIAWEELQESMKNIGELAPATTYHGTAGRDFFSNPPAKDKQSQSQA